MTRVSEDRASQPIGQSGAPRIGLFGLLGSGNIGNDGSMEAVLGYLREAHPDSDVDVMCAGPDEVTRRFGLPATRLNWNRAEYRTVSTAAALVTKALGKIVDAARVARWVRRHDVVIVPGMGVLEATLPLRPWGFPYSLFLLAVSGRLFRTRVALVSVGANADGHTVTRWLMTTTARLAHYRSFRDDLSRDAVASAGVDVTNDAVYPDVAFALPTPVRVQRSRAVGVGVMAYRGSNDDRGVAGGIYAAYVAKITDVVRRLLDRGYQVRLVTGDEDDEHVTAEVVDAVRAERPTLPGSHVVAEPVRSLGELMTQLSRVDLVIASRYHNVLCALSMAVPTISIGYSAKNDVLMRQVGLDGFCQSVDEFDVTRLMAQFDALEQQDGTLRGVLAGRAEHNRERLAEQFTLISKTVIRHEPATSSTARAGSSASTGSSGKTGEPS